MKIKRYKKFQRNMGFFVKNFGFHPPYQVLVDGTFAHAALENKVNIREQLPKCLNAAVKLLTSPCAMREAEQIGSVLSGALKILRSFPIHKCGHEDKSNVNASKCLKSMVRPSNSSRYVIATQDGNLREALRNIPGVPLLYLHGNAPTLEAPSETSQTTATESIAKKTDVQGYQKEILDEMKKKSDIEIADTTIRKGTKKRKRSGPNPLSCKKAKKSNTTSLTSASESKEQPKKKRKRPKLKVPKHVKEVLTITTTC